MNYKSDHVKSQVASRLAQGNTMPRQRHPPFRGWMARGIQPLDYLTCSTVTPLSVNEATSPTRCDLLGGVSAPGPKATRRARFAVIATNLLPRTVVNTLISNIH